MQDHTVFGVAVMIPQGVIANNRHCELLGTPKFDIHEMGNTNIKYGDQVL